MNGHLNVDLNWNNTNSYFSTYFLRDCFATGSPVGIEADVDGFSAPLFCTSMTYSKNSVKFVSSSTSIGLGLDQTWAVKTLKSATADAIISLKFFSISSGLNDSAVAIIPFSFFTASYRLAPAI